ncbi:hypothetical protein [Butyrivibrio sp. WCD3002]|uniref:hypothetical protein n=1 Tax=Butyrivibrio sp. WCD3002 TaxID=1280676 RepID=UPI00040C201E|nr:hypothetical protein [Butyrivibrio sp. WCD3002]
MIKGWFLWKILRIKYGINYKKVVLVLSGENRALDMACIDNLPDFIGRKYARAAIIFYPEDVYSLGDFDISPGDNVKLISLPGGDISKLYDYYCFMKFFDNIVFTFTDKPADNLLQRYLDETDINEDDAACLALYHLRYVPGASGTKG